MKRMSAVTWATHHVQILLARLPAPLAKKMSYLLRGGFWLGSATILSTLFTLAQAIIFGRYLNKGDYGTYKYIFSITSLIVLATLPGMNTAITLSISRGFEGNLQRGIKTRLRWGLLSGFLGLLVGIYYLLIQAQTTLGVSLLIASLFLPFMDPLGSYDAFLQGKERFRTSATYGVFFQLISTALVMLSVYLFQNVILTVLIAFSSWTLLNGLFLYKTLKLQTNRATDTELLTYGKKASIVKVVNTAIGSASNIALFQILGPSALAIYALSIAPIEHIRMLMGLSGNLILPKLSSGEWNVRSLGHLLRKIAPFLVLLVGIIMLYVLVAPFLFQVLFPNYSESIALSRLYAPSLILTFINIFLTSILRAKNAIKPFHVLNALEGVSLVVIVFPAIYFFGIKGLLGAIMINKFIQMTYLANVAFPKTTSPSV